MLIVTSGGGKHCVRPHARPQRIRYLRISVGSVWLDELIEDILLSLIPWMDSHFEIS